MVSFNDKGDELSGSKQQLNNCKLLKEGCVPPQLAKQSVNE
jgi:hypothetical protein